jgi:hypothetical protein
VSVVAKPVDVRELEAALNRVVGAGATGSQPAAARLHPPEGSAAQAL